MGRSSRANFVLQRGFRDASEPASSLQYPALMFQPRLIGGLVVVGLILQAPWLFLALGAVLWWSALAPGLPPFDAAYNALYAGRPDRPELVPAPAPRRFAQAIAGTLALIAGLALATGRQLVARGVEGLLVAALVALVFGRLCVGSYLFHLLRGDGDFARRTLPWARDRQ